MAEKKKESVVKNTGILFAGDMGSKIITFFLMILITRKLGVDNFGVFSFALGFASLFVILADLGIENYMRREISRDIKHINNYVTNGLLIKSLLALVAIIISAGTALALGYPLSTALLVLLAILSMIFETLSGAFMAAFIATQKVIYTTTNKIIRILLRFAIVLPLLLLGFGAREVLIAFVASYAISFLLLAYRYHTKVAKFTWVAKFPDAVALVKKGLPFGIATIFINIYFKIDITMLSKMQGDAAVGIYSAAYNLLEGLYYIPIGLTTAMLPITAILFLKDHKKLKNYAQKAARFMFIITIPIAIGSAMLAPGIIRLIYGEKYAGSAAALAVLIWTIIPSFLTYILGLLLVSSNQEKIGMLTTGSAAVVNIVLNLILIPSYGFIGSSWATVITEVFLVVFNYELVRRSLFALSLKDFVKPAIAGLAMGAVLFVLPAWHVLLLIAIGAVVYFLMLFLLRDIRKEDLSYLRKLMKKDA